MAHLLLCGSRVDDEPYGPTDAPIGGCVCSGHSTGAAVNHVRAQYADSGGAATPMSSTAGSLRDRARSGSPVWMTYDNGRRRMLPTGQWFGAERATAGNRLADLHLLRACKGPTLDIGIAPGRLAASLVRRGVCAIAVDTDPTASTDPLGVLDLVPARRTWSHALLADGSIGIGGDPLALLFRVRTLLADRATLVVEVDPETRRGLECETVRWETDAAAGPWFPWAHIDAPALAAAASVAGMTVEMITRTQGRSFVHLSR